MFLARVCAKLELNYCTLVAAVRIMFNLYKNGSLATWPRPLFDFLRRGSPHQSFHWLKNFLAVKGLHYASFFETHFLRVLYNYAESATAFVSVACYLLCVLSAARLSAVRYPVYLTVHAFVYLFLTS